MNATFALTTLAQTLYSIAVEKQQPLNVYALDRTASSMWEKNASSPFEQRATVFDIREILINELLTAGLEVNRVGEVYTLYISSNSYGLHINEDTGEVLTLNDVPVTLAEKEVSLSELLAEEEPEQEAEEQEPEQEEEEQEPEQEHAQETPVNKLKRILLEAGIKIKSLKGNSTLATLRMENLDGSATLATPLRISFTEGRVYTSVDDNESRVDRLIPIFAKAGLAIMFIATDYKPVSELSTTQILAIKSLADKFYVNKIDINKFKSLDFDPAVNTFRALLYKFYSIESAQHKELLDQLLALAEIKEELSDNLALSISIASEVTRLSGVVVTYLDYKAWLSSKGSELFDTAVSKILTPTQIDNLSTNGLLDSGLVYTLGLVENPDANLDEILSRKPSKESIAQDKLDSMSAEDKAILADLMSDEDELKPETTERAKSFKQANSEFISLSNLSSGKFLAHKAGSFTRAFPGTTYEECITTWWSTLTDEVKSQLDRSFKGNNSQVYKMLEHKLNKHNIVLAQLIA